MIIRNVAILILHYKGKLLLQKRSITAKRFPNTWGFFGGGAEEGESARDALEREIKEEVGLKLKEPQFLATYPYTLKECAEVGKIFTFAQKFCGSKLSLNEGQEMKWVYPEEALTLNMHQIYRKILEDIIQNHSFVLS